MMLVWLRQQERRRRRQYSSTVLVKQLLRYSSSLEGTSVAKTIDIDIDSFQYSTTAVRSADNINTIK